MSDIAARLESLGITIPHRAAAPAGVYAPAVLSGNLVFTAGTLPALGKVGAEVSPEVARDCARTAAINALAAVAEVIGSLDRVVRVVKVVGFVASDPGFVALPGVIDGASEV